MPVSHTCPTCCAELGRIRALPDPHYGLQVVVCPRCDTPVVRLRHPDRQYWRSLRRLRKALTRLYLTILLLAIILWTVLGMGVWFRPVVLARNGQYRLPDLANPELPAQLIVATILLLISGFVARVQFAHLRFSCALGFFVVLFLLVWSLDAIYAGLLRVAIELGGLSETAGGPSAQDLIRRAKMLPVILPLFVAGMAAGTPVNRRIQQGAFGRVARLRRRVRQRRRRLD